jgi:hypothetical protein
MLVSGECIGGRGVHSSAGNLLCWMLIFFLLNVRESFFHRGRGICVVYVGAFELWSKVIEQGNGDGGNVESDDTPSISSSLNVMYVVL